MTLPAICTPELLNQLYREHDKAEIVGRDAWFRKRLAELGLADHEEELTTAFAIVLGSSYSFLCTYPGGAVNSDELWAENDAVMLKASPWLDEQNYGSAKYYARYYAWHDGLVADK